MTFLLHAQSCGLVLDHVVADGRWHRVKTVDHPKKRNGAYIWDGRRGACQNWATMQEPAAWKPDADYRPPPVDHKAMAQRKREERENRNRAIRACAEYWAKCKPLTSGHKYLQDHGLDMTGCHGLRVDATGWLAVPVMIQKTLRSVQRISPDGEKRFWPGAPVKGGYYLIDRPAQVTVVCEGLATGLALFAACRMARVYVAFDAGNLKTIKIRPVGLTTIAADNDLSTFEATGANPGVEAAKCASERFGCGMSVPEGIAGSDWCDWRRENLSKRLRALPPKSYMTQAQVQRATDAELAGHIMRATKFI